MLSLTGHQTRLLLTLVNVALKRAEGVCARAPAERVAARTARRDAYRRLKQHLEANLRREEGAAYVPGPRWPARGAAPPPGIP